jgi:DNA-binding transcriptional MerR regulator
MKFTTFDIVKKLGVHRSSLKQWMERDLIRPSIQKADGQGTKNLFSLEDLYRIGVFRAFCSTGFGQKEASEMANNINLENIGSGYRYCIVDVEKTDEHDGVFFSIGGSSLTNNIPSQPSKGHYGFLVIDFRTIKDDIDARVKE